MKCRRSRRKSLIFTHDIEGVKSATQIACSLVQAVANNSRKKFQKSQKFADDFKSEDESDDDDGVTYSCPLLQSRKEFRKLQRRLHRIQGAMCQSPRALLVALVSAFDAYFGKLLRAILTAPPVPNPPSVIAFFKHVEPP